MIPNKKAVFNWSGGKDSALALQKVILEKEYEVIALLTTIDKKANASTLHGIPVHILQVQANSLGIPLYIVKLNSKLQDDEGEMLQAIKHFKSIGVSHFIFGDIFLDYVKTYREEKLDPHGIEVVMPLWDKTSKEVMKEFIESGIEAQIIVTDASKLDETYVGKKLTQTLVDSFPADIDCCGELGEYHTLAYSGPIFKKKVKFKITETKHLSIDIGISDGTTQQFNYWQAILK